MSVVNLSKPPCLACELESGRLRTYSGGVSRVHSCVGVSDNGEIYNVSAALCAVDERVDKRCKECGSTNTSVHLLPCHDGQDFSLLCGTLRIDCLECNASSETRLEWALKLGYSTTKEPITLEHKE